MGSLQNWHRNKQASISLFFFLSVFIFIHVTSMAEGRGIETPLMEGHTGSTKSVAELEEKVGMMMMSRNRLGSRPPSCRRRCKECGGHCEAVQVPVALQDSHKNQRSRRRSHLSAAVNTPKTASKHDVDVVVVALSSEDETSNYKPISWKCKCGNFIFNP